MLIAALALTSFLTALYYTATTTQAGRKWERQKQKIDDAKNKCTQTFKVRMLSDEQKYKWADKERSRPECVCVVKEKKDWRRCRENRIVDYFVWRLFHMRNGVIIVLSSTPWGVYQNRVDEDCRDTAVLVGGCVGTPLNLSRRHNVKFLVLVVLCDIAKTTPFHIRRNRGPVHSRTC